MTVWFNSDLSLIIKWLIHLAAENNWSSIINIISFLGQSKIANGFSQNKLKNLSLNRLENH